MTQRHHEINILHFILIADNHQKQALLYLTLRCIVTPVMTLFPSYINAFPSQFLLMWETVLDCIFSIHRADESFFSIDNRIGVFWNITFIDRDHFHFGKTNLRFVFIFVKIGTEFFSRRKELFPNHSSKIIIKETLLGCWIVSFIKTYFFWDFEFVV